jgi:hypothetical protein
MNMKGLIDSTLREGEQAPGKAWENAPGTANEPDSACMAALMEQGKLPIITPCVIWLKPWRSIFPADCGDQGTAHIS